MDEINVGAAVIVALVAVIAFMFRKITKQTKVIDRLDAELSAAERKEEAFRKQSVGR